MATEILDPTAAREREVSLTCSTVRTVRGCDLDQVLGDPRPVLVAFETEGNLPCVLLAPCLEELANEFGRRVVIVRVPDAGDATVAARHHLLWIPTLAFWRGGREILRLAGAAPTNAVRACLLSLLDQSPFPEPVLGPRRAVRSAFHPTRRPPRR
jgi:thioredoxin-like negative regulator of GroEL